METTTAQFLTASWRNLLMANFETDPAILHPYIPAGVELDDWNGKHYVSLVGFLFQDTRVKGLSIPFHRNFEEVNLRFYLRYKHPQDGWRRGVAFVKELVPRRMITLVANTLYREKYATCPMRHTWNTSHPQGLQVRYEWKTPAGWNHLSAIASQEAAYVPEGTKEHFITEHYWGYTRRSAVETSAYQVLHPSWRIHPVHDFSFHCDTEHLYGPAFTETLQPPPASVFLAEGSEIAVMQGTKL